jgi:drug/metabolite transporter (DMT)-like permease
MPIALALIAALVYGTSDFLGGLASRRSSTTSVVVWSQIVGFILLACYLALAGFHATPADLAWGAVCGLAGTAAIVALYRGLASGAMGVVSSLSAVFGAVVPMLYGVALRHEHPAWLAYAGIVAALVAVVCVSISGTTQMRGIPEGLIAGLMFGAYFIALAQTRPEAGLVPLLAARATTIVVLLAGGLAFAGVASIRPARESRLQILFCGVFDVSANVLFVVAMHSGGMLSLVAVLTSLYPAATVALAAIVLRERLRLLQWIGVALALGGAAAIVASQ